MKKQLMLAACAFLLFATQCTEPKSTATKEASLDHKENATDDFAGAKALETATVIFETNATDGDVEVVFEAKAGDDGMTMLKILAPDGRVVADISAPDKSTLGLRQFRIESPEPKDIAGLKRAYPEGEYQFLATSITGKKFSSKSTLNHTLPGTITFVNPEEEAEDVEIKGLVITWTPVKNVTKYLVEVEQEESGISNTAKLPGSATSFSVPANFLQPGTEYKISIGTMTAEGNLSFVETSFTTAE